jgi:very-short-patch-repair endonuclease
MNERAAFARRLRHNATPEERMLWNALSRFRPRFTRQLRLGPYTADLACRRARIVIEVDGSQHAESQTDAQRTAALASDGWRVLRFWNSEVRANIDGVVQAVAAAIDERLPPGEATGFIGSRAGRQRRPRTRKKGPPPAPPASAGGES